MCSRAKPWSDGAPVAPSGPPLQRWHCETGLDVGGDYKKNRLTGRDRGEKVRVSSPLNPAPAPLSSQIACSSLVNSAAQPSSVRIEGKPLVLCKRHGGNSLLLYAPSTPRDSRDFFPSTVLLLIRGSSRSRRFAPLRNPLPARRNLTHPLHPPLSDLCADPRRPASAFLQHPSKPNERGDSIGNQGRAIASLGVTPCLKSQQSRRLSKRRSSAPKSRRSSRRRPRRVSTAMPPRMPRLASCASARSSSSMRLPRPAKTT
jgi:hypothetical protein